MSDIQPLTTASGAAGDQIITEITMSTTSTTPLKSTSSSNLGGVSGTNIEMSPFQPNDNINIGQQSPPPSHNYRHSRAYRHFKNPPQPHMCIRTTTVLGDELFINVLSWTRIVIPQEPSDPIPLYGGMRVQPGRPRMPLVYAVMANPEVLKDSGRHSKDPEERRAMVELMCDFVEAMNPDVKLTRNALILKDRDISGELKDVWNAVQAQRDREREEQITQQQRQQQQHYHNVTTQQLFPKANDQSRQFPINQIDVNNLTNHETTNNEQLVGNQTEMINDNKILYMEFGPSSTATATTPSTQPIHNDIHSNINYNNDIEKIVTTNNSNEMLAQSAINNMANINFTFSDKDNILNLPNHIENCINNDTTDSNTIQHDLQIKNHLNNIEPVTAVHKTVNSSVQIETQINCKNTNSNHQTGKVINQTIQNNITTANNSHTIKITTAITTTTTSPLTTATTNNSNSTITTTTAATTTTTSTTTTATSTPTKRGGFLPNGCIFPRFKNNKHKDKDKEKEKEKDKDKSSSIKEKTLLNSLKKVTSQSSKSHHNNQQQQQHENKNQQFDKNCMNLDNEMEKLDLNKLDSSGSNDVLIKVKSDAK